jgi:DNA primase
VASIDFRMVRSQIGMEAVLDLLGFVPTQRRGGQVRGPCPIHKPRSPEGRSFSAHLERNAYRCFRCGSRGNQLDLWAAATRQPLYQAAIELCAKLHRPVPWLSRRPAGRTKSAVPS